MILWTVDEEILCSLTLWIMILKPRSCSQGGESLPIFTAERLGLSERLFSYPGMFLSRPLLN